MSRSNHGLGSLPRGRMGDWFKPRIALVICSLAAAFGGTSCSNDKHDEYCEHRNGNEQKPPTCRSLEEMQRDFRYWDGFGEVVSVDDGPRESPYSQWEISCCDHVTYRGGGS